MTTRTDDEIIATGPRDCPEAQRVQEMLAKAVQRALIETDDYESDKAVNEAHRLLQAIPMIRRLRLDEARRLERMWSVDVTVPVDRTELDWFISMMQESAPPVDED